MNSSETELNKSPHLLRLLGPGLVTGAADDDPSGIATYSQAGAQFGYGLLWTVFLTTPFMIAIQLVSAQIGRVTGKGIIANVKDFAPRCHCLHPPHSVGRSVRARCLAGCRG